MIAGEHIAVSRDASPFVLEIYKAARLVRRYARGGRSGIQHLQREQAILLLGLTIRDAFNNCDNYEELLKAILDGLGAPTF